TMHAAMFEALNFVIGRYRSLLTVVPPNPLAMSRPAVACVAAHTILLEFYPEQRAFLDGRLKQALDELPEGSEKASALILGRAIARNVYAALSNESKAFHVTQFDVARWSGVVSRAATLNDLDLLDNARFYAIGAAAIRESYFANATKSDGRCGACVTSAALSAVLSAQFGRPYPDLLGPEPVLNGDSEGSRLGARLGAEIARIALAGRPGRQTFLQGQQPPVSP
ncbi:MAG TPA: hypothetical protein VHL85_12355, partial [Burkholderiales bacterium]|nr:hypothetical protein [Burkholderiales bacterium]